MNFRMWNQRAFHFVIYHLCEYVSLELRGVGYAFNQRWSHFGLIANRFKEFYGERGIM